MDPLKANTPTGRTVVSGGAGGAIGYLFVTFLPEFSSIELTVEQASGVTAAIGSLCSFLWHQIEYYRSKVERVIHGDTGQ